MGPLIVLGTLPPPTIVAIGFLTVAILVRFFGPQLRFIWHCFIRPLGSQDQRDRLDKVRLSSEGQSEAHSNQFYEGQADIYDKTRSSLLRGRNTMLSLSASHLRTVRASQTEKQRLVWIDIGGGTGTAP